MLARSKLMNRSWWGFIVEMLLTCTNDAAGWFCFRQAVGTAADMSSQGDSLWSWRCVLRLQLPARRGMHVELLSIGAVVNAPAHILHAHAWTCASGHKSDSVPRMQRDDVWKLRAKRLIVFTQRPELPLSKAPNTAAAPVQPHQTLWFKSGRM